MSELGQSRRFDPGPSLPVYPDQRTSQSLSACLKGANNGSSLLTRSPCRRAREADRDGRHRSRSACACVPATQNLERLWRSRPEPFDCVVGPLCVGDRFLHHSTTANDYADLHRPWRASRV
jgi:hypothetical protein